MNLSIFWIRCGCIECMDLLWNCIGMMWNIRDAHWKTKQQEVRDCAPLTSNKERLSTYEFMSWDDKYVIFAVLLRILEREIQTLIVKSGQWFIVLFIVKNENKVKM